MKLKNLLLVIAVALTVSGCNSCAETAARKIVESSGMSAREAYEAGYGTALDACVEGLVNSGTANSEQATRMCDCMLETAYSLDSTFLYSGVNAIAELVGDHPEEFDKCKELLNVPTEE
jgi:hypothetical protein